MVKSVIDGATTYDVGAHYIIPVGDEVLAGTLSKYYFAGSSLYPHGMRVDGVLSYLLGDHLGSTSITTDQNGVLTAEMRYKAWGETRYASGATPTDYHYTSQREDASIGLYFYREASLWDNARWSRSTSEGGYDPYINHFAQPDTLIPDQNNVLDWNRYAYTRWNPTKYTDPTGHVVWDDPYEESDGVCNTGDTSCNWVGNPTNDPTPEVQPPSVSQNTISHVALYISEGYIAAISEDDFIIRYKMFVWVPELRRYGVFMITRDPFSPAELALNYFPDSGYFFIDDDGAFMLPQVGYSWEAGGLWGSGIDLNLSGVSRYSVVNGGSVGLVGGSYTQSTDDLGRYNNSVTGFGLNGGASVSALIEGEWHTYSGFSESLIVTEDFFEAMALYINISAIFP